MANSSTPETVTLLELLVAGFEQNEVANGFHTRRLPLVDEAAAVSQFEALSAEGVRWKGTPLRFEQGFRRQVAAWVDLEIRQAGRGVMLRVKAPGTASWHAATASSGDPLRAITDWIDEEDARC